MRQCTVQRIEPSMLIRRIPKIGFIPLNGSLYHHALEPRMLQGITLLYSRCSEVLGAKPEMNKLCGRDRFFARVACFVALASIMSIFAAGAFAQAVSQISGITTDQSGAAVPGVEITATQTDTGLKRTVQSDESGSFILTNLPTGPYRLEASKSGFRTYVQTGIELQVSSSPNIPITLGVGQVSETVEVQANASQIETQKLGVGSVIENQRILELPLNGRNAVDLVVLSGAAVQTGTSPVWAMKTGVNISVAGGQSYGVYYSLDGAPHSNLYDATGLPLPFPDALQEFKVETSTQSATGGMHSGGTVSSVTKSGTNAFHGDAFEFLRNGAVNARNFFAAQTDTLKRNQFGGTVGGPIKKDKLFFFAGYQGTTIRQVPLSTTVFVPTAKMMQGDFSDYYNPANKCPGTATPLKAPFVNNVLPNGAAGVNQAVRNIFNTGLIPQTNDPCGRVLTGNRVSEYQWQLPVRVDFQLTNKQTLFARYIITKINTVIPFELTPKDVLTTANLGTGQGNGADDAAQSLALGHTYLLSSTTVNSFRLSANRTTQDRPGARFFGPSDIGVNAYSYVPKYMVISVTNGPSIGCATCADLDLHSTYWTANDDLSLVKGSHQIGFGGNYTQSLVNNHFNVRSPGNYTFNGTVTGLGLADFIVGQMQGATSAYRQSSPNPLIVSHKFFGLYAQDTWKVNQKLTVNYGLRWEPFFPQQVKNQSIYNFSLDNFYKGIISKVYTNAPAGFTYPGDPGFSGNAGINKQWKNFQPRVGISWDPIGDGKTVIRAAAGISYDFVNEALHHNTVCFSPFCGDLAVNGPIPFDNPWRDYPAGSPFPSCCPGHPPTGVYPQGSTYMPIDPNIKTPEVQNWNLGIQRQLTSNWFGAASYLGSHAIHMWTLIEQNPGVFLGTGPCTLQTPGTTTPTKTFPDCSTTASLNFRRVLNLANPVGAQSISNLTAYDSGATQQYHGLLLNTQYRTRQGLTFIANYTLSHCIGDTTIGNTVPNPGNVFYHQNNRALDRGACGNAGGVGFDRRHLFNLTVVGQTPKFENRVARTVGSGWTISGLYRFQSGTPLTVNNGADRDATGTQTTNQRPNLLLTDTAAPNQGQSCAAVNCVSWLNPAAFALPAIGTQGNLGANNILGPRFWQLDLAVSRQFAIREGATFEVRAEAFNILNGVRFNNPGLSVAAPQTFGLITSAQDPRILQFAGKFIF
jgi:hypothetical protein